MSNLESDHTMLFGLLMLPTKKTRATMFIYFLDTPQFIHYLANLLSFVSFTSPTFPERYEKIKSSKRWITSKMIHFVEFNFKF